MATSSRAELARDFFIELGYKPWQAAGIVGNLMQESGPGLDTGAEGDDGSAHGIAQWRDDPKGGKRFTNLKEFAEGEGADWKDFQTQLKFVDFELKNHETDAYTALIEAKDVPSATAAMIGYERPKGYTPKNPSGGHGWSARLENAMGLAGMPKSSAQGGAYGTSATLDQVMANDKGIGSDAVASKSKAAPSEEGSTLADMDFAGLFTPPDFPPLPELPPIPDPVPLQYSEQPWKPTEFATRRPWSRLPGQLQAPRRPA